MLVGCAETVGVGVVGAMTRCRMGRAAGAGAFAATALVVLDVDLDGGSAGAPNLKSLIGADGGLTNGAMVTIVHELE